MKFGSVPVSAAEGAVLAHSLALPTGKMRKGRVLTPADIALLQQAGLKEVTAAVLTQGDVHENAAAAQLAAALCGDANSITISPPFTGRCNLLAPWPGVVTLDVAAIEMVNAVHPMITVATVPPRHQMGTGGMIATIKVISYAVPEAALVAACDAAKGAIGLAEPVYHSARLIITEVPGGVGDKGRDAIAARLAALNVGLGAVTLVPHEEMALAQAIRVADEDIVLILTGSATSDIDDVAPAALRAAGGSVERFGMPVDPGNL